jgi:hypothetical protein
MAKLYWRVKKNGKWNWVAACDTNTIEDDETIELIDSLRYVEEEE